MSGGTATAALSFIESMMEALAPFMIVIIIWGVIALGFFIWYLWAMARLFPRLGLSAGQGWIPLWNEWKLMDRVGLPGWTVLLALVGLGIVPLIIRTIAQHRIGREVGVGGGYTLLGLILAPLWATLIGSLLHGQVLGQSRVAAWPNGQPGVGTTPGASGGNAYAAGQGAPFGQSAPFADQGRVNPYAAPVFQESSAPRQNAPWAPPAAAPGVNPAANAAAAAPAAQVPPFGHSAGQTTPPAVGEPGLPSTPGYPAQLGGAPTPFTAETEAEYARLANEAFLAPPAAPLGQPRSSEPFSWTAASRSVEPDPVPPIPAPPIHPISAVSTPPVNPPGAPTPAPPILPARPAAPVMPATGSSQGAQIPLPPGEETRTNAVEQGAAAPLSARGSSSGITANYNPLPPVPRANGADDDEFDRTVVVQRGPVVTWQLVLPDGDALELSPDTVVGRRPETPAEAVALQIPDPTRTLSKTHARFRFDGEQWTVEDLGSTNGVFVISAEGVERELEPGSPAAVSSRVMLGTLEVRLRRSDETE